MSLGRHVENSFYLKEFVTWQVCEMLSDISLGGVFTLLLQLPRRSPCSLTDSQIHGLIKTGRFFEKKPLVGRHVLNVRPKKGVNLSSFTTDAKSVLEQRSHTRTLSFSVSLATCLFPLLSVRV